MLDADALVVAADFRDDDADSGTAFEAGGRGMGNFEEASTCGRRDGTTRLT